MVLNNIEVRQAIEKKRMKYYEVAQAIGISSCTLSRWLESDLTPERKERILKAIEEFKF